MSTVRHFCFTSFEDVPPEFDDSWMTYLLVGHELTEEGRPHWQGYVQCKKTRWNTVLERFHGIHCEPAHGDAWDNYEYCTKSDPDFLDWGSFKFQGMRSDLLGAVEHIAETREHPLDMALDMSWTRVVAKHDRFFQRIHTHVLNKNERSDKPELIYVWGAPGSGKSKWVWDQIKESGLSYYTHAYDGNWFQRYTQQDIVLFDEFRGQLPLSTVLMITDRYPCFVNQKGTDPISFTSKRIFIVSPHPPEEVYTHAFNDKDNVEQFLRRIDIIKHM